MIEMYDLASPVRHTDRWDLLRCSGGEVVEVSKGLTSEQIAGVLGELCTHMPYPAGTYYLRVRSRED